MGKEIAGGKRIAGRVVFFQQSGGGAYPEGTVRRAAHRARFKITGPVVLYQSLGGQIVPEQGKAGYKPEATAAVHLDVAYCPAAGRLQQAETLGRGIVQVQTLFGAHP